MESIFKIVSWLEGLSYVLLLFVAVPLKYLADSPEYVRMLGMPHGLFFIAYIVLAFLIKPDYKWTMKIFGIVCLLSLIPFGTFFVGKYLKKDS